MKKLVLLLLVIGGGLAGGAWWYNHRLVDSSLPVAYTRLAVEHGELVETVSSTGIVQPRQVYLVGAEVPGRVVELAADYNEEVSEGQLLLRMDDQALVQQRDQAKTAVEAAEAGVDQARSARDTAQKALEEEQKLPVGVRKEGRVLVLSGHVSTAEANLKLSLVKVTQARQALAQAEYALSKAVVRVPAFRSPSDRPHVGTVHDNGSTPEPRKYLILERKVSLGQQLLPPVSSHLYTLAGGLNVVQIEAQVAEGDISKVTPGLEAEFTVASYETVDKFRGKVTEVRLLPINDRGAVFYKVIIEAPNQRDRATGRWKLTPGLTATIEIIRRKHENVWKMPVMAFNFQPDEAKLSEAARSKLKRGESANWRTVWVVGEDGTPWPVFVRTGGTNAAGQSGITDLSFTEILEWDPEMKTVPVAGKEETYPQVIIAAPQTKSGLFNTPVKF